jgi:hypothetical protein
MNMHLFLGLLVWIVGISCMLLITVYPMIFWLYVIPKIQKRLRKKMTYNPKFYCYPFLSKYMAYTDIAFSIFLRFLKIKIFKNQDKYNFDIERPLGTISYDIRYASKLEIILSFMVTLNCIVAAIALLTAGILSHTK